MFCHVLCPTLRCFLFLSLRIFVYVSVVVHPCNQVDVVLKIRPVSCMAKCSSCHLTVFHFQLWIVGPFRILWTAADSVTRLAFPTKCTLSVMRDSTSWVLQSASARRTEPGAERKLFAGVILTILISWELGHRNWNKSFRLCTTPLFLKGFSVLWFTFVCELRQHTSSLSHVGLWPLNDRRIFDDPDICLRSAI